MFAVSGADNVSKVSLVIYRMVDNAEAGLNNEHAILVGESHQFSYNVHLH